MPAAIGLHLGVVDGLFAATRVVCVIYLPQLAAPVGIVKAEAP